jgi:hypothetical protein
MCDFYDSKSYVGCNEERAESVSDSERANFCDYFTPSNKVFKARDRMKSAEAKAKFAALFGDEPVDNIAYTHTAPDAQETPDQHTSEPLTSKQLAEQKLRDLLGG